MPKILRIASYFLLFFILLFVIIGTLFNLYFNKKVIEVLKEQVAKSSKYEYALSLDELRMDLLTHQISITNWVIAPTKMDSAHLKPKYIIKAKKLKIIDLSILSYFRKHELLIDRIEFEEPQISIYQGSERLPKKDVHPGPDTIAFSLYKAFSKKLNSITIGNIDIKNSKINVYKTGTASTFVFSTNDNSLSIKKFSINSETDMNNRLFFAEKFEIVMNKFSYHLGNGLYTLNGKSIYASYLDSILIIDSLQLIPNFSKKEFASEAGYQTNRAKIISSKVYCQKIDVKSFFEYNSLAIQKVNFSGVSIDVYRDNNLPLKLVKRPSLQTIIKKLPFYVAVDTLEMKDGKASFEILNPGANASGKIKFNKMNITITGVYNDTTEYTDKQQIKGEVDGLIFNQGKFKETYTFPLKATKEQFQCSGSLSSMPMAYFNPMVEPATHILIKSGQLDHLSFSFDADDFSSKGTMKFLYHDLKVEVETKNGERRKFKEKIKTFAANVLIAKDNNTDKNGIVRVSKIHAVHNPYRYFTFYSTQSVISGIAPAIAGEKMAKMLKKKKK